MTPEAPNYKTTLNLPKTPFEMKANLTQREPEMLKRWTALAPAGIYKKIRQAPHPKGKWVLHDGPPYANGDIHMGHLINKVLKDIVVKFRTMQGYDSPYVPGWDCHGLPIESAIQKELGPKFRELTKDEVRKRCAAYANKYVKLQGDSFQRLGIFGSFDNPYLTLDKRYEAGILEVFAELVSRDLVYRQKKPVHWCTNDRTALAEAELEYATKKDTSIFVTVKLDKNSIPQGFVPENFKHIVPELMFWTTTPWTIPANRAIAANPKHQYDFVTYRTKDGILHLVIVANARLSSIPLQAEKMGFTEVSKNSIKQFSGKLLEGIQYSHPLDPSRFQPVVLADYVTLEDGTGLVHTAPGHGKEDYLTGMKYGLEVYNPVLSDGRYDETVPAFLQGQTIWDANKMVLERLDKSGALFNAEEFSHEYPHCWRCKKPVIFRATEQWFIAVDKPVGLASDPSGLGAKTIRERAVASASMNPEYAMTEDQGNLHAKWKAEDEEQSRLSFEARERGDVSTSPPEYRRKELNEEVNAVFKFHSMREVKYVPAWGENRLNGMLQTRPDWCISRQRSWGVPIPAFFDPQGKCLLTQASVRKIAAYFKDHGADSWYTDSPAQLLGTDPAALGFPAGTNIATLEKGMDILDVWFESGASHHAVLECTHPELGYPADMYLEGSDQHRGWFQSSLLEASGYKPVPPFKEVLTHGFVVDDHGKKYSKSSGNYVPVEKLLTQHGADVLRLWVSSVDYQNDIKFSSAGVTTTGEAYRKIRNTMKYLLGNLYDFNPTTDAVEPNPHSIDAWMLAKVATWAADIRAAYDRYEFHQVFKLIYEFCNVEISAVYAKAIKDRLYCELPTSPKRRASQTVCYRALLHLIESCAPVLVFTSEEAWTELRKLPGTSALADSIHLHNLTQIAPKNAQTTPDNAQTMHDNAQNEPIFDPLKAWTDRLLPLIEKGNKQLDDLKRTIGLGNPLDAEAIIVLPKVEDEVSKLIANYAPEIEDALGVGFHRIEQGEVWDIKIVDTREKYPSCARSWKRRPDVGSDKDFPDLSARDAQVVRTLRSH